MRQAAALDAAKHLVNHPIFKCSNNIACYLFVKDEFNAYPIIHAIWQANKKCYLPVLTGKEENSLLFVEYEKDAPLHNNRYSIPEPVNKEKKIALEKLDLVIAPLVAFDLQGHRLGAGGGYYDRTFAFRQQNTNKKPQIIGLGFAAQQADTLPAEPWDISLDGVLTEVEFIVFP